MARTSKHCPRTSAQALKVGDEVYAYVVQPEDQNGNVVLSMAKAIAEKDWRYAEELYQKQEAIETVIAGFNKGGVIIKVGRLRGFVPCVAAELDASAHAGRRERCRPSSVSRSLLARKR